MLQEIDDAMALTKLDRYVLLGSEVEVKQLLTVLQSEGYTVEFCIIQETQAAQIAGIPVYRLFDEAIRTKPKNNLTLIISYFGYKIDYEKINISFAELGFTRFITYWDVYSLLYERMGANYWLTDPHFYDDKRPAIEEVGTLFADETSGKLFKNLISGRKNLDFSKIIRTNSMKDQYFPGDVPELLFSNFIDCGAYTGDTYLECLKRNKPLLTYIAFEPDENNYKKLKTAITRHSSPSSIALAFPCGVWSSTRKLCFSENGELDSKVNENGKSIIQCVAIDEAVAGLRVDSLKMDIEGAEYEALLGAKDTIIANKSSLAISIYHKPEDIFAIPLLIHSWFSKKKMYMRAHALCGFELVLYVFPE